MTLQDNKLAGVQSIISIT